MRKLPQVYEIQTTNRCNGQCIICPSRDMDNEKRDMEFDLFSKIIDEISLQKESEVRIVLYLNGEPFLDADFIRKLHYTREKCKDAEIEISSNISMMTDEIIEAMCECRVDDFRISCFGFFDESYEYAMPGLRFDVFKKNIQKLIDSKEMGRFVGDISLTMIDYCDLKKVDYEKANEFCINNNIQFNFWGFLDRTGNVKKYSNQICLSEESVQKKEYTCAQHRHLERMHILADGRVSLCCQDWRERYILGDIKKNSIVEIWNCDEYEMIRKSIDEIGVPYPDICKKCKILLEGKKI